MQRDTLDIVKVFVIIDTATLPLHLPYEIRLAIGREMVRSMCYHWVTAKLKSMTLYCANPLPRLPLATCFKLWCGRLTLECMKAYSSSNIPPSERLKPMHNRRAETLILLENRVVYRSFDRPGYMD